VKKFLIHLAVLSFLNLSIALAEDFTDDFNKFEKKIYKTLEKDYNGLGVMNIFGYRYSEGIENFPKDFNRALYWFNKASNGGYPLATFNLGISYYNGDLGLERDIKKAHEFLVLAFEQRYFELNDLFYASIDELSSAFKNTPSNSAEFQNLKELFIDSVSLPSNTRYNRLKNLSQKKPVINPDSLLEEFIKTEQIICDGNGTINKKGVYEIFKVKIYGSSGDFIILRKIGEFDEKFDEYLDHEDFLLELQFAKQNDKQIEWFEYKNSKDFGIETNNFTHYKLFIDDKQQLKLYEQPYHIKASKEFNLKMNQKYNYKKYDLLENFGSKKHIELEEEFYSELNNNYLNIMKNTNNGQNLTQEYLCEL